MRIAIRNYVAGSFLLESEPGRWDTIAILDSGFEATDFLAEYAPRHVTLTFDDVSRELPGKRAPMLADIRKGIDFGRDAENLLVCCRAGQSRSAALAFSIAHASGETDPASLLNPRRHDPNKRVIQIAATALSDSSLLTAFDGWRLTNQHIRLADHFEEIEREQDAIEAMGARNRIAVQRSAPNRPD